MFLIDNFAFYFFFPIAVQHERAPKVHGTGATVHNSSNMHHYHAAGGASSLYSSRYQIQDFIFPFPMHLTSHSFPNFPFPLDSYYNPTPYFNINPLQAMNLKTHDLKYKSNQLPNTSTFSSELLAGKNMSSNLLFPQIAQPSQLSQVKIKENMQNALKDDEVTSSEETIVKNSSSESTTLLFDTTKKILLSAIKWAKSIPSFQQLICEGKFYCCF